MGSLADTLFEKPLFQPDPCSRQKEETTLNQFLADEIASKRFDVQHLPDRKKWVPTYMKDNPLLPGMDNFDIVDHEKQRWSSIFECTKWAGGVYAAYKWAPQFMPKEIPPSALIAWKKRTGEEHIVFGSKSHSELLKELKLKYIATCVGSMAVGWTANHALDRLLFPKDQYLEGTLLGDAAGIWLAIAVPGWRNKAMLVAGLHLAGKTVDHWQQPKYPTRP